MTIFSEALVAPLILELPRYHWYVKLLGAGFQVPLATVTVEPTLSLPEIVGTAAALGIVQAVAGFAPGEIAFGALLVGVGIGNLLFITAANSLVQMSSNVQIRGRVISLYILVLLGGQALGGPLMGWIVEAAGPHVAMAISGLVPAAAAVVVALMIARHASLRLRFGLRGRRPVIAIVNRAGKAGATL